MRRFVRVVAVLCFLASATASFVTTQTNVASAADSKRERENVRKQNASIAAQINVLKASDAEIQAALATLNGNVSSAQAVLTDAQRGAAEAATQAETARVATEAAKAELAGRRLELRSIAVQSYVAPPIASRIGNEDFSNASDYVRQQALLSVWSKRADDLADGVEVAASDLAVAQAATEQAAAEAAARKDEVQSRVNELRSARAQQRKLKSQVEGKLEAALAESAALSVLDKKLSDQIAAESRKYSSGGGSSGRLPTGNVNLETVRGITVASSIADNLSKMLTAAANDGVTFGGGGYRSSSAQVSLRRQNCGSSDYATYSAPASSCSPPTARPGSSNHERGLAIDFTYNGSVISSHSSPGYIWLKNNASRYGFYNLPSEPWHWSVNGN